MCGHSTTTAKRQVPRFLASECPHDNTDFRGSDKNTHRVYCLDCCSVVTKLPQAVYKEQKKAIYNAIHSGEILFRDIVHESAAPDVPSDQVLRVVR